MKDHFSGKEVGYAYFTYEVIDCQNFHISGMKDPDYTMMLMKTYGTLERSDNERKRRVNGETVWFKYS